MNNLKINRFLITLIFGLSISFSSSAQCPVISIDLLDQASVNSFPTDYPGCNFIPDGIDLKILGNDIIDLTPLQQLTGTDGVLEIRNCPSLNSLAGLENITKIGNDPLDGFILRELPALTTLSPLSNLDSITGEFTIRSCPQLNNLIGLDNLNYVNGSVIIRENNSLVSLQGLNTLDYIGETLELVLNPSLTNISALSNVDNILGGIEGGVFIEANNNLESLVGLGNSNTVIGSNLDLLLNDSLAFCSVPSICNYLANPPIGAVITINANVVGCNTQPEIETGCLSVSLSDVLNSVYVFALRTNPVNSELVIETNLTTSSIVVFNSLGKATILYLAKGINSIDVSDWAQGVYYIRYEENKIVKWVKL
jgi:hypothetical protein